MHKILVMTDLHLTLPGKTIIGLDPSDRFRAGLDHAARSHPDADRLIIMGDLTHNGHRAEYAVLKSLLTNLPWPATLMIGNHDNREAFFAEFPEVEGDQNGFVQSAVHLGDLVLLCLDSTDPAPKIDHAGHLCQKRLNWLEGELTHALNALIFIHHPPFYTGFDAMDDIGLLNAAELRHMLRRYPATRHVFAGHIHRTITATVEGLAMTIFKSPCHQMPMVLAGADSTNSVDEPGAYGIILADGPNVVVHFEDFTLPEQPPLSYAH